MNIQDMWEKALKKTEIIRPRVHYLSSFGDTHIPYIFLAESAVNAGDTVARSGEIIVEKPSIILPSNLPQFDGFDFENELHLNEDTFLNFLLVRGVSFPSLKYNNRTYSVDVYEGRLNKAINHYLRKLQQKEDTHTGLITGPEDSWQLSVLIFIGSQIERSAGNDIRNFFKRFGNGGKG
jgi:hypothetical protein